MYKGGVSYEDSQMWFGEEENQSTNIEEGLGPCTFLDKKQTADAFKDISQSESEIENFVSSLKGTEREKEWQIPSPTLNEKALYKDFKMIIENILTHFKLEDQRFIGYDPTSNLCIRTMVPDATQPNNFPAFASNMSKSYLVCVSPIKVTTEEKFKEDQVLRDIAYYAIQIFVHQGNRHLVNSFVLTERHMRLYVFARDGVHYSDKFDIHKHPARFVRYILGAASLQPEVVGYDESIYWQNHRRYMDVSKFAPDLGTLRLVESNPVFNYRAILCHGTTSWIGQSKSGDIYFIKDSWRSHERPNESVLLETVKKIPGVGQMVAAQDTMTTIAQVRNINKETMSEGMGTFLKDLVLSRIVLPYYGPTLEGFSNELQLVTALHDAICGYRKLFEKGILHQNINVNNVLIGKRGAKEGDRGILIDLDMAILRNRINSLAVKGF